MDKRTLLFVLSLTVTLFAVNLYFESQNTESSKEWHQQQISKKKKQIQILEEEIKDRTAKPSDLPIVNLYSDPNDKNFITSGIKSDKSVITLSWDKQLPKTIYLNNQSLTNSFNPEKVDQLTIYGLSDITIGNLPYFGSYDLQLLIPQPKNQKEPYRIILGQFKDGNFSIPLLELNNLKKQVAKKPEDVVDIRIQNAIVLLKSNTSYLPVAIFEHETGSLKLLSQMKEISTSPQIKEEKEQTQVSTSERFYVIENDFTQLVFSNVGGSLAEINLPFQSKDNKKSVVKEIEFDREMVKKFPYNAQFPSHHYYTADENGKLIKHDQTQLGGYYPLLRRDLLRPQGQKSVQILPKYYAFNLVSEYPEMAELIYKVTKFTKNSITFEATQPNRTITKTYSVNKNEKNAPYIVDLTISIQGDSRGLWLTSGVPEIEWISNGIAPALKYRITKKQKSEVSTITLPKDSITVSSTYPDWVVNSNGFLGMILDPLTQIDSGYQAQFVPGTIAPSRLVEFSNDNSKFSSDKLPGYMLLLPLNSKGGTMHFRLFTGPFATNILKKIDGIYSDPSTGYNPDYIASQSFHGWFAFISAPFSKFLFILMNFFHFITGSWGFSIILLTVALRIMLYPLNSWSTKSMYRMQQIAPEITAIQEKHKKDPKKAQLAIMNLYRDRGVNPVSGCFPMLIQMPFLIGMFDLLKSTFELRGATFIPGWIDNLAAPDVLFSWSTPIFFIGNEFHLLPIFLGGVMFLQQKVTSTLPKDTSKLTDQQRQQKAMGTMMAVVFTVMFYNFPSGLNIYWLSSMLLGMGQQWWTTKKLKAKGIK